MAAKLKADRERREGMKRFTEWKRKTRARIQWLADTGRWREPIVADPPTPAHDESKT
jgi:hypothetical protein